MTGPSITGSENGIPISIASAPASSSPRRSSASTPGSPPVTYGTKARPPEFLRSRSPPSRSGEPKGLADRVEVLVAAARQTHEDGLSFGQRTPQQPSDRVRRFERREDPLGPGQGLEPLERVGVGGGRVLGQPGLLQEAVLRPHAR